MVREQAVEIGLAGRDVLEGRPGDFVYVAPGAVHRESNPTDQESHIVVVRSGSGPSVTNVDGPESAVSHPRDRAG